MEQSILVALNDEAVKQCRAEKTAVKWAVQKKQLSNGYIRRGTENKKIKRGLKRKKRNTSFFFYYFLVYKNYSTIW